MLHELWARGGVGGVPNRYTLTRIEAIDPGEAASGFKLKVEQIEARRGGPAGASSPFNAPITPDPDGEKVAVRDRLKAQFARTDMLQRANLMLALHGCSHETAAAICTNGFASIATRDNGFFGNGIYLTTHAEYACDYANGTIDNTPVAANAAGEHVVVVSWVAPGLAYPLSRAVDYAPGVHHNGEHYSNFYVPPPAAPSALKPPFDSHYVCVRRGTYQAFDGVRSGTLADYDELVLKEAQQALPAYLLYFR